ncbi:hypothetical protein PENSOL_c029G06672 [Penicillium solitum]|uniref:Uncharacterized protein n=1 Tax=Penicillium solitum TaxID=60172 RepID=A0A1V6QXG4_9EURO|nr:uncharacterized protein PENSOL_c029G06672 [Penicillium solitum]OQD93878.1 hypothetical protein PENSOL_c029G06672 [Penicillium solitum]
MGIDISTTPKRQAKFVEKRPQYNYPDEFSGTFYRNGGNPGCLTVRFTPTTIYRMNQTAGAGKRKRNDQSECKDTIIYYGGLAEWSKAID